MDSASPELNIPGSIVKRLGMDTISDQREYVRSMKARYGKKGTQFMKHMDRRGKTAADNSGLSARKGYRLKNSDWRMSLQVSQHSEAEKHAAFIEWLCQSTLASPAKACEVGCDIGIQACAMKLLWPDSHITGFDQVNEAVLSAEHHAKSHALRDINFEQLDLRSELPRCHFGSFDLVICPWTLHEVVPSTNISVDELREESLRSPALEVMQVIAKVTKSVQLNSQEKQALENLSDLVKPGGQLVSVDRMAYGLPQQQPIIRELAKHGFDHVQSDQIIVHSEIGEERFPIFVLRKTV